jgi:2-polyprenyl-3-methyl-5-hydroxy-6-metoxy-1,4-benzoquinol methylase
MISQDQFLQKELEVGIHKDNPNFLKLCIDTAKQVLHLKDLSVIDYGAGTGAYSHALQLKGFNVVAQDIFKSHRDYMKENLPELKVIARPVKADFMLFIEVAEHMTDSEIVKAVEIIQPKYILFSSTSEKTEQDEDWGHVNIKSQSEWIMFWSELGFTLETILDKPTKWTKLLKRFGV